MTIRATQDTFHGLKEIITSHSHIPFFESNNISIIIHVYNITYGLDYLFNELNEDDYYEPTEIKSAFDGSYMLYESRGDKDAKLAIYEYFDIIRPYLRDMIHNHKARGEWKNLKGIVNLFSCDS